MKTFELQPLRITVGWKVTYNMFSEYDPDKDGAEYSLELCEDLLQLKNKNLLIDLGWYPQGNINGGYKMFLVDTTKDRPFDSPLETFASRSKREIINKLEYWINPGFYSKYVR